MDGVSTGGPGPELGDEGGGARAGVAELQPPGGAVHEHPPRHEPGAGRRRGLVGRYTREGGGLVGGYIGPVDLFSASGWTTVGQRFEGEDVVGNLRNIPPGESWVCPGSKPSLSHDCRTTCRAEVDWSVDNKKLDKRADSGG